jgi:hypothetical protein
VAFGLTEGMSNSHPEQGTANRRYFLRNAMLELLWVHDEREARSSPLRVSGNDGSTAPLGTRPSVSALVRANNMPQPAQQRPSQRGRTIRPICRPNCRSTLLLRRTAASQCYSSYRLAKDRIACLSGDANRSSTLEDLVRSRLCV